MGDNEITSVGTVTDLPLPAPADSGSHKAKAPTAAKVQPKTDIPAAALPADAEEYKKLVAKVERLGIKLDFLDDQGCIKPDKLEEVKARVAQALDAKIKDAGSKGVKPDDAQAVGLVFLPHLLKNTEFVLLPRETQIALLKEKGFATPEKFVEAIQKDYPPNRKYAHALRLEAQTREDKGGIEDKKDAARFYDVASAFDPGNIDIHRAAARTFKAWGDSETNNDDKLKLYATVLSHLDPVIKADPKDVELLKTAGQILTALGQPAEAEKLYGMAMKIKFDEYMALKAEQKKNPPLHHPSRPEGKTEAEGRVKALEALLKEVEAVPANSPEVKLLKLQCQLDYHKAYDHFQLSIYPPPIGIWQPSPEYDKYCEKLRSDLAPYKAKVDEVLQSMNQVRGELKKKADDAGLLPADRIAAAKLSLQYAAATGDNKARVEDLDHWKKVLDSFGYSDLHGGARGQAYADLLKEWFQFRQEMTDPDVIDWSSDARKQRFSIDAFEATARMRDIAPRIRESFDYLDVKGAQDSIEHLVNRLIDMDDAKVLPYLSTEGLEKFAKATFEADQQFEIAKKNFSEAKTPEDLKKARGELVQTLATYVALRDSSKAGDIVKLVEGSIKPETTDAGKLEIYTALAMTLKESDFSDYGSVKDKGSALAAKVSSQAILTATFSESKTPIEDARQLLLARTFFETVGDAKSAKSVEVGLAGLGDKIINVLNSADPKVRPSTSKERVELAAMVVQIDQVVLGNDISEASKVDSKGPLVNTVQSARLGVLRNELEKATDLPFNERLEQFKKLASAAATYQTLTKPIQEGQKPIIDPDTLKTETAAITKLGDSILDDALKPGPDATDDQKKLAEKMAGDLKTRFHQAMEKGEVSWLSEMTPASLGEFAMVSGKANRLLDQAKALPAAKADQAMALYLEAGKQFGLLGLNGRVTESLKPVLEYARGLPDPMARLSGFLAVSEVYQQAKMTTEANAALQEIVDMDKPGVAANVSEAAQIARAMQKLNSGDLDSAKALLKKLPKSETARILLAKIDEGQKAHRVAQAIEVVRTVFMSQAQSLREKGKTDEADRFEKATNGAMEEAKRLVMSGKYENLEAAFRKLMDDPRFYVLGLGGYFFETGPGWKTWSFVRIADDPRVSSQKFGEIAISFASSMTGDKYYGAADSIATLFLDDPYVGDKAKELKADIPDRIKAEGVFKTVKGLVAMNPVGLFLEITFTPKELGSDEDPIKDILIDAGIGIATFGIGKGFAVAADAIYVSRAASLLSRPLLYSAGRWAVRSGAEATGFVLGGMTAQTLLTGRTDHWTLSHFGKEWGSMLVMFGLLHGVGMGFGRFGKYAEGRGWASSTTFQATFKTAQYASSISAMVGASKINQALGLKEKDKSSLYLQFLGEMATFHLMNRTQKVFEGTLEAATLGKVKLSQVERGTQARLESQMQVKKMGIDPASTDGRLLVDLMIGKVSEADFAAQAQKRFGETVKSGLKVNPESPEGKQFSTLLFLYANQAGKDGKPLTDAEVQTAVQKLNHSASKFLTESGIGDGKASESLRQQILSLALEGKMSPETLGHFAEQGPAMKKDLGAIVDKVLGKDASGTPQGQRLMGALLLKSFSETSDPAQLQSGLKVLGEAASEAGMSLRITCDSLLGSGSIKTAEGRELMALLLTNAMSGSEKPAEILAKLTELSDVSSETGKSLRATMEAVLGKDAAKTPEGRKMAVALLVSGLSIADGLAELPKLMEKVQALAETLSGQPPNFFELSDLKTGKDRLALFQWALQSGENPASMKALKEKLIQGEVELVLEKGEVKLKDVPKEAQEAQRQKIFDRIPLEEIPAQFIQEVYVQEMKVENLGGGKLRYVAYREGKEVGNITVREEKDGGLFLGFADTAEAHRGKGVMETLLAEAAQGKTYVSMRVIHPETDKALQAAFKKGASAEELNKIFAESPLGKALAKSGFNSHELTRSARNGSYSVVSKKGADKAATETETPLTAAALLGVQVGGRPLKTRAVPLTGTPQNLSEYAGQRSLVGLKIAEDFGFRDNVEFRRDMGNLLEGDIRAARTIKDGKREDVIRDRARAALELAQKYGKESDPAFKKALAKFLVENIQGAEKFGPQGPKGGGEWIGDILKGDLEGFLAKIAGVRPAKPVVRSDAMRAIDDPELLKDIQFLSKTGTPFAEAAKKALEGKMTVAEYRAAQKEIGETLVATHRIPLHKVMTFLKGLTTDPAIKDRLPRLKDESGRPIKNPQGRMKDPADLDSKLIRRGWSDLGPLTDIGGARVVVRNNEDAKAVIAEIESKFKVRALISEEGYQETKVVGTELVGNQEVHLLDVVMDRDTTQRLEIGHPERGYRALHVVVEVDGKPIEIQIQTQGMYEWGKIQHSLVYKNKDLPADTVKALETYCRDAAQFISERENGRTDAERPKFPDLPKTLKPAERGRIAADLKGMDALMTKYEGTAKATVNLQGEVIPNGAGVFLGGKNPVTLDFNRTFFQIFQVQTTSGKGLGLTVFGSKNGDGSPGNSTLYLRETDPVKIFRKEGQGYKEVPFSEGKLPEGGTGKSQFALNSGDIVEVDGTRFVFLRDPKELKARSDYAREYNDVKNDPVKAAEHLKKMEGLGRAPDGTPLTEKTALEGKMAPPGPEDSKVSAARKGSAALKASPALKAVPGFSGDMTKVERPKGGAGAAKVNQVYSNVDQTEIAGFLYQKIIGGDQIVVDGKPIGGYLPTVGVQAFGGGDISRSQSNGKYVTTFDAKTPGLGHAEELRDSTVQWMKDQGLKEVQAHYITEPGHPTIPKGIRITGLQSVKDQLVVEISFKTDAAPELGAVEKTRDDFQKEYGQKITDILQKVQKDPFSVPQGEANDAWTASNARALIDLTLPEVKKMEAELKPKDLTNFSDPKVIKYLKAKEQLAIYQEALEKYAAKQKLKDGTDTGPTKIVVGEPVTPPPKGSETSGVRSKDAKEEPLVFKIGDGESPGLIVPSNEKSATWRVKSVSADGKSMVLENVEDPSFTVKAAAPREHGFKVGQGVLTAGIGGGGRAMPWVQTAQVARSLIAQHEFENGDKSGSYDQAKDTPQIKAARAYVAAVEAGRAPPTDTSFVAGVKDFYYSVSGVEKGKSRPLGILVPAESLMRDGKLSAHNERWKFTVVGVDANGITVRDAKGETRTLEGLPASRGAKEKMPHLFKVGDAVVLVPNIAGGSSLPGEGPAAAFQVPFRQMAQGQFVVELGRKVTREFETLDDVSDQHVQIRYDQAKGTFAVDDLGSKTGTFVVENGQWVQVQKGEPRALQFDQVFALGPNRFFKFGRDFLIHPTANPLAVVEPPAETGPLASDGKIRTLSPTKADKNFVVGSSKGDLMFYDSLVSGVHMTLEPRGSDGWFLHDGAIGVDKRSTNGIWVNGVRITEKTVPIQSGDLIQIQGLKNGQQVVNEFRFIPPPELQVEPQPMAARKAAPLIDPAKSKWVNAPLTFSADPGRAGTEVAILGRGSAKGGNPANLFVIPSSEVSRQHAQVRKTGSGEYFLTDLNSSNGTWIKEKSGDWTLLEKRNEVPLEVGQEFALGTVKPDGSTKDAVVMVIDKDGRIYTQSEMNLSKPADSSKPAVSSKADSVPPPPVWQAELKAGDVADMVNPPVVSVKASDKMGSSSAVSTQGVQGKENEDGILHVRGPKGELYLFDADGMGGQGNGAIAAKLSLEAYRDEIQRTGDPEKAMKFANAVVSRFNGSIWVLNGLDPSNPPPTKTGQAAALKKISQSPPDIVQAAEAEARKCLADPKLASFQAGPMKNGAGAVAVSMSVQPPAKPGDPHVVNFHWVGDARGVIFERGNDGQWHWVYRTVDESAVGNPDLAASDPDYALDPGTHYFEGGRGKTLVMMLHPKANIVVNGLGRGYENVKIKKTGDGEIPNPQDPTGASPAKPLENGIAIKKGQLAVLGSDGLWENFGHTALVEALIKDCKTSDDVVKVLTDETHFRMEVLRQAREYLKQNPSADKFKFERPEGILYGVLVERTYRDNTGVEQKYIDVEIRKTTTLYIDKNGKVYENLTDTQPVDHYKTDNLSIMAYLHDPTAAKTAAPAKKAPPPVPKAAKEDPEEKRMIDEMLGEHKGDSADQLRKFAAQLRGEGTPFYDKAAKAFEAQAQLIEKSPDVTHEAVLDEPGRILSPDLQLLPLANLEPLEPFVIGKGDPKDAVGIKIDDPTLSEVHASLRKNRFGDLYVYNGTIGGKPSVTGISIRRHSSAGSTDIKVRDVMQIEPGDLLVVPILGGEKVYALDPTGVKYLPMPAPMPTAAAAQIGSVEGTLYGSSAQKTLVGAVELGLLTEGGKSKTVSILFGNKAPGLWVSEGESPNFSGLSLFEVWKERGSYIIKFKEDAFTEGNGKVEILGNGNTKPPSRLDPQRILREGGEYTIKIADHTIKIKLPPTEEGAMPMAAYKGTLPRKPPPPPRNPIKPDPNDPKLKK